MGLLLGIGMHACVVALVGLAAHRGRGAGGRFGLGAAGRLLVFSVKGKSPSEVSRGAQSQRLTVACFLETGQRRRLPLAPQRLVNKVGSPQIRGRQAVPVLVLQERQRTVIPFEISRVRQQPT